MTGQVVDQASGETLIGATVVAIHTPSGTSYGTITNENGYYRMSNLRVGGPYFVKVSYTGYGDIALEGVNLRLGETRKFDFKMESSATELTTIEITAGAGTAGESAGASTQISTQAIENMPTLNRNLGDYVKLTPQGGSYGTEGGTAFGGVNNRYNAIYIDGAINNDVFGLAGSGTNGGQTGIAPFSIDIIDQFQVVLSPYDVTMGGFAGAGINAVTKSGTNNFEGTAYYFFQNQGMVGKTNGKLTERTGNDATKVDDFTKSTYGASLGGPIIRDRVFFFVNAEIQKDEVPAPYDIDTYGGNSSIADLENLRANLISNYGYDPGTFGNTADQLDGLKLFGKIDFNINKDHRLTIRHNYTKAEQYDRYAGSGNTINFSNNGIYFPSTTNSTALELNSRFGNTMSNNLILGYTTVLDDRDGFGDFPYLFIEDGGSNVIRLGTDEFSTANNLDQKIFTLTDNFKIYRGAHTITLGTHNEFYDIYNLFIGQNYGTYRYASLADFLAGNPAKEYDRLYSLVDNKTGDGSAAAADFKAMQLGFYVQDEWVVSPRFTLTGGLRVDIPILSTDPDIHPSFNTTTLPLLQAKYDVANNIEGGTAPDGQLMFSPRLGFSYDLMGDNKTTLRGGLGIFTSRIPFVWPGAMYNNNGLTVGRVDENSAGETILFRPNVNNQYTNADFTVPSGDINIFTKDFKYPQVFRGNLAVDTELPGGITATLEGIYTKTLNNVLYTNVNSDPTVKHNWIAGGDDRPVFTRSNIDNTYSAVYVGSNTSDGYTYSVTASLAKKFDFGLNATLAYTYGDAQAVSEGTSSQNSSQWRGQVSIDGRNNPVLGRSDFALGHRLISSLNYKINWTRDQTFATNFTLFYDGMAGSPYSYIIGGSNARNLNNETGSTSRNRSLIWIPADASEINLVDYISNGVTVTAAEQWANLNAFIEDDPYLSANRGGYAEKNSNYMPWTNFLDFSVRQDFGIRAGGKTHKLQVSWDVFNFLNLLNSDWGARYNVVGDFNNFFLYQLETNANNATPEFTYRLGDKKGKDALDVSDYSSRWQMRLGLRYIFN
ncbi:MAG: carboxypeptidase regulatory-like domain-containing protein [Saprospiraceae bacterium]|nr:carboxypeptidase regulatory-like domain-containing protein [Saprospiraceae bacterium]